jgi:hypothetical protein
MKGRSPDAESEQLVHVEEASEPYPLTNSSPGRDVQIHRRHVKEVDAAHIRKAGGNHSRRRAERVNVRVFVLNTVKRKNSQECAGETISSTNPITATPFSPSHLREVAETRTKDDGTAHGDGDFVRARHFRDHGAAKLLAFGTSAIERVCAHLGVHCAANIGLVQEAALQVPVGKKKGPHGFFSVFLNRTLRKQGPGWPFLRWEGSGYATYEGVIENGSTDGDRRDIVKVDFPIPKVAEGNVHAGSGDVVAVHLIATDLAVGGNLMIHAAKKNDTNNK